LRTPKEERELHIGGYVYKEDGTKETTLDVYTSDYGYMLKFDKFCEEYPEDWQLKETMKQAGDIVGKRYRVSLGCILIRGRKPTRTLSEEQKEAMRKRLSKIRKVGD